MPFPLPLANNFFLWSLLFHFEARKVRFISDFQYQIATSDFLIQKLKTTQTRDFIFAGLLELFRSGFKFGLIFPFSLNAF